MARSIRPILLLAAVGMLASACSEIPTGSTAAPEASAFPGTALSAELLAGIDVGSLKSQAAPRFALGGGSSAGGIRLGVWYPYGGPNGVPSAADLAAEGITRTDISGNLTASVLANYDVVFVGRNAVYGGHGVTADPAAVASWVAAGGTLIGESNATVYDSNASGRGNWSSEMSRIMGVSSTYNGGGDWGSSRLNITITDPAHPVTQGVASSYQVTSTSGFLAYLGNAYVDTAKNPLAVKIGTVEQAHIIAATYGDGCSVYFPVAFGYSGTPWSSMPNQRQFFVNAVKNCANAAPVDETAPVVVPTITGTLDDNGWYTSDVVVSWSVTDEESEIDSSIGCETVTVSSDTAALAFTCTATSAGGETIGAVAVKRDATAPLVSGEVSGTVGSNGWFTSAVSFTWTSSDALSGVAPSSCVAGSAAQTTGSTVECTVTDLAGNSATAGVSFKIDSSAPAISFTGAASYSISQEVSIVCAVSDAISGISASVCPSVSGPAYSFGNGATLVANATNGAGLVSSESFTFTVTVTGADLCAVVRSVVTSSDVADGLCSKVAAMTSAKNANAKAGQLGAFRNQVRAQTGKSISVADAAMLISWAEKL